MKEYVKAEITGLRVKNGKLIISSGLPGVKGPDGNRLELPDVKIQTGRRFFPDNPVGMAGKGDMPESPVLVPVPGIGREVFFRAEERGGRLYLDAAEVGVCSLIPGDQKICTLPAQDAYREAFLLMRICSVHYDYSDILTAMDACAENPVQWSLEDIRGCAMSVNRMDEAMYSAARNVFDQRIPDEVRELEGEKPSPSC